jgi:hypothetical protein
MWTAHLAQVHEVNVQYRKICWLYVVPVTCSRINLYPRPPRYLLLLRDRAIAFILPVVPPEDPCDTSPRSTCQPTAMSALCCGAQRTLPGPFTSLPFQKRQCTEWARHSATTRIFCMPKLNGRVNMFRRRMSSTRESSGTVD